MKCLTVCHPWAWCILSGHKTCENRSWPTSYRGSLLIHAGLSRRSLTAQVRRKIKRLGVELPPESQMTFGAIIGICTLVDCVPLEAVTADSWAVGPWCFLLSDVTALPKPIPFRGKQKLFNPNLSSLQRRQIICQSSWPEEAQFRAGRSTCGHAAG